MNPKINLLNIKIITLNIRVKKIKNLLRQGQTNQKNPLKLLKKYPKIYSTSLKLVTSNVFKKRKLYFRNFDIYD